MSRSNNPPISVAEAVEMVATEDSWINDGLKAVVRSIKQPAPNAQKKFWKCVLADETGSATINFTCFTFPKFGEGDLIELTGQGIKRKEYQGTPEVSIGKNSEIHVLGKSAHHEEQKQAAQTGAPSVNGQPQPVHGQTVGMALKEALALAGMAADGITRAKLADPLFWQDVKTYAGNIIRISKSLEAGKLSPPSWPTPKPVDAPPDRSPPPRSSAPTPTGKPTPGHDGAAFPADAGADEDVPF